MVIQKTVDNLKERPKDERKAVAAGLAITIMGILFFGWAFLFLKKLQRGGAELNLQGNAQNEFNFSSVKEAQEEIMKSFNAKDELRQVRDEGAPQDAGSQGAGGSGGYQSDTDQFGNSGGVE